MKRPNRLPSSSKEVVGDVPLWHLWAEAQVKRGQRGQELLDAGAFTVMDFVRKTGWTRNKARHHLGITLKLKGEIASDPRLTRSREVHFFFPPAIPPKEKAPSSHTRGPKS